MIIRKAAAHGVRVQLVDGTLMASGPVDARNQWLPTLERFRDELLAIAKAIADLSAKLVVTIEPRHHTDWLRPRNA